MVLTVWRVEHDVSPVLGKEALMVEKQLTVTTHPTGHRQPSEEEDPPLQVSPHLAKVTTGRPEKLLTQFND